MQTLGLPPVQTPVKMSGGQERIFCISRKKWLVLTPEEWVRQHWINYLNKELGYPIGLISVEREIKVGQVKKRYDIVLFDKQGQATMLVECKAPKIKIDQRTLDQAIRYNLQLRVHYLLISNGLQHYCLQANLESGEISQLPNIPSFSS